MVEISTDQLIALNTGITECKTEIVGMSDKIQQLFDFHNANINKQNDFMMAIQTQLSHFECSEKKRIDEHAGILKELKLQIKDNTDVREDSEIIKEWKAKIIKKMITWIGVGSLLLSAIYTMKRLGWLVF